MSKLVITPDSHRTDSYKLGAQVIKDGFRPDYLVALWRGGAQIGCYVHELLKYVGIDTDHIAIRTSRFTGINETKSHVTVYNLGYLVERLNKDSKVLLVDDVYDSGLSIDAVYNALKEKIGDNTPFDIRVATLHYKPTKNKTSRVPNYYVHESNEWIVYPHELEGLTDAEIREAMGSEIADLVKETVENCLNNK